MNLDLSDFKKIEKRKTTRGEWIHIMYHYTTHTVSIKKREEGKFQVKVKVLSRYIILERLASKYSGDLSLPLSSLCWF